MAAHCIRVAAPHTEPGRSQHAPLHMRASLVVHRSAARLLLGHGPMPGTPRVVAFVARWSAARERDDRTIRAELRGLGAELVVFSRDGIWSFGPDDHVERRDGDVIAAAREYRVAPGHDAVFVVDEHDAIRFEHRPDGELHTSLAKALSLAGSAARTQTQRFTCSRREWLIGCLVAGCSIAVFANCKSRDRDDSPQPAVAPPATTELDIVLDVNGKRRGLRVEPRVSLLDALRERLGLTGTKKGCDAGQCGACTVLIDNQRVLSCLTLAVMAQDKRIVTIEGLAKGDELHPVQAAFASHDALQCGFCTPGQICSAVGLLAEGRVTSDDDVREQMSGNICRCGAYPNIVAAIQAARRGAA
jgi:xanthine dehydrogenase YagT iron-sulfur-binding subunit